tara:strand:+ start:25501 stop:25686 length:186 start_codon:yes stop_codon:yes gene_type:complete
MKLEKIPMPWDKNMTRVDEINMLESQIIIALENLRELNVPRRSVVKFLIEWVKNIFKKGSQ